MLVFFDLNIFYEYVRIPKIQLFQSLLQLLTWSWQHLPCDDTNFQSIYHMHFPLWALTLTSFVVHSVSIPPNDLIVNFSSRNPLHPNLLDNSATMNHLWLLLSSNTLEYSAAPSPLIQASAVCNIMHSPPPSSSDARVFNDTGLSSSWLSTFVEHCFSLVLPHSMFSFAHLAYDVNSANTCGVVAPGTSEAPPVPWQSWLLFFIGHSSPAILSVVTNLITEATLQCSCTLKSWRLPSLPFWGSFLLSTSTIPSHLWSCSVSSHVQLAYLCRWWVFSMLLHFLSSAWFAALMLPLIPSLFLSYILVLSH